MFWLWLMHWNMMGSRVVDLLSSKWKLGAHMTGEVGYPHYSCFLWVPLLRVLAAWGSEARAIEIC